MKQIRQIQGIIAGVIIAGVLAWQLGVWRNTADYWVNKWLKNDAVQGCLEVGYEEYNNSAQNSKAVTFNRGAYEFCMEEKK